MYRRFILGLCFLLLCLPKLSTAQVVADTTAVNEKRLLVLGTALGAGYTGLLVSLNKAWYSKQERTNFHFFDDAAEWKQVDKAGHFWSAFQESRAGIDLLRSAGVPEKKAILYGGLLGVALQTPVEVFDGYQSAYGASITDLAANTLGAAAVLTQELIWHKIRIMPKYSFHTTQYASLRPNVLGNSIAEQALKDYNGQTYWLSVNLADFMKVESKYPKWLSIAVGYGAEEMVFNSTGGNEALGLGAHRQFYLSPDLNLMQFKGKNRLLNTALYVLSMVKVPAPALEYNSKNGFRLHALYF